MFNKKTLVAIMALGALAGASSAFASRATTLVMGTGDGGAMLNGGSLYYDDAYNMFYNPAVINDYKNWATVEKSNFPGSTAQGGFVTSFSSFNFGVYMNRGDAVVAYPGYANGTAFNTAGTNYNSGAATTPQKPIELYFGGDMGVKWGLGMTYAQRRVQAGDSDFMMLSAGANVMGIEPFLAYQLMGRDTDKDKKNGYWRFGARYKWGEWVPYIALSQSKFKNDLNSAGVENKEMTWGLGFGRNMKISEGARLAYSASWWNVKDTTKASASATEINTKRFIMPLEISVEGDAASWITLRAGLQYRLLDRRNDGTGDIADNTKGRMGATIHATKNADFDFAFGSANNPTTSPAETTASADNQTFGLGSGFVAAANATYRW